MFIMLIHLASTQSLRLGITSVSGALWFSVFAIYPETFFQNKVLATESCIMLLEML